jgi:hypothetical protein
LLDEQNRQTSDLRKLIFLVWLLWLMMMMMMIIVGVYGSKNAMKAAGTILIRWQNNACWMSKTDRHLI